MAINKLIVALAATCTVGTSLARAQPAPDTDSVEPTEAPAPDDTTAQESPAEPGPTPPAPDAPEAPPPDVGADASAEVTPAMTTDVAASVESATSTSSWQISVAPRFGLTVPTSKLDAFVVGGLEVAYALPVASRRLLVAVDASMTYPSHSGTVMDPRVGGEHDYQIDEREIKLAVDVVYRLFGPERKLVPWAGIGPIVQFLKSRETTTIAPGKNITTNAEVGFEVAAGADLRVGPGYAVGDVRVIYTNLDHYLTGNSNAGNINVAVGYRLVF